MRLRHESLEGAGGGGFVVVGSLALSGSLFPLIALPCASLLCLTVIVIIYRVFLGRWDETGTSTI